VTGKLNPNFGDIRRGSPYVRFEDTDYYISFSYIQIKIPSNSYFIQDCLIYRPVLTIIKADIKDSTNPAFRLIYTSELFDLSDVLFKSSIIGEIYYQNYGICYHSQILAIGSIAKWDYRNDLIDITVNINDKINAAIRLKGITKVVKAVTNADLKYQCKYKGNCLIKKIAHQKKVFLLN
jgi:hypothetical protein